jgi:crotonobetainyl-CoA:carnitine CoA-transferase CaiB-like acyl-CoA transferase
MSTRPFAGLRIAEFGRYVAGPYAAELFAHGGADVIKFEDIGGDETRRNSEIIPGEGRQFIIKARGKRELAIDLQSEEGARIARQIVAGCDIVVSNLRPGTLERFGLDYEAMSAVSPALIYGEISGFGEEGPEAGRASIDVMMQAWSGLMISNRSRDEGRPVASEAFLCDYMAATTLAFGITVALRERDRTGRGQKVSTSLMNAAFALQHGTASIIDIVDGWKRDLVETSHNGAATATDLFDQRRSQMASNRWFYNTYATADGYVAIAAPGRLRVRLLDLLGFEDPALSDPDWVMPDDPRPYLAGMYEQARQLISRWHTDDLVAACEERGLPCAPVRTLEEAMLSEQALASGAIYEFDHPVVGPVAMPQAPLHFSDLDYRAAGSSPAYGADTVAILREGGFDDEAIARLIELGVVGTPETSPFA